MTSDVFAAATVNSSATPAPIAATEEGLTRPWLIHKHSSRDTTDYRPIRVGSNYQADVPEYIGNDAATSAELDKLMNPEEIDDSIEEDSDKEQEPKILHIELHKHGRIGRKKDNVYAMRRTLHRRRYGLYRRRSSLQKKSEEENENRSEVVLTAESYPKNEHNYAAEEISKTSLKSDKSPPEKPPRKKVSSDLQLKVFSYSQRNFSLEFDNEIQSKALSNLHLSPQKSILKTEDPKSAINECEIEVPIEPEEQILDDIKIPSRICLVRGVIQSDIIVPDSTIETIGVRNKCSCNECGRPINLKRHINFGTTSIEQYDAQPIKPYHCARRQLCNEMLQSLKQRTTPRFRSSTKYPRLHKMFSAHSLLTHEKYFMPLETSIIKNNEVNSDDKATKINSRWNKSLVKGFPSNHSERLKTYIARAETFNFKEEEALEILQMGSFDFDVAETCLPIYRRVTMKRPAVCMADLAFLDRMIIKENRVDLLRFLTVSPKIDRIFSVYYRQKTFRYKSFFSISREFLNSQYLEKQSLFTIWLDSFLNDTQSSFSNKIEVTAEDLEELCLYVRKIKHRPSLFDRDGDIKQAMQYYRKLRRECRFLNLKIIKELREFQALHNKYYRIVEKSQRTRKWNRLDIIIVCEGFKCHGQDYKTIAQALGTKDIEDVKQFYFEHRKFVKIINEYTDTNQKHQVLLNYMKHIKSGSDASFIFPLKRDFNINDSVVEEITRTEFIPVTNIVVTEIPDIPHDSIPALSPTLDTELGSFEESFVDVETDIERSPVKDSTEDEENEDIDSELLTSYEFGGEVEIDTATDSTAISKTSNPLQELEIELRNKLLTQPKFVEPDSQGLENRIPMISSTNHNRITNKMNLSGLSSRGSSKKSSSEDEPLPVGPFQDFTSQSNFSWPSSLCGRQTNSNILDQLDLSPIPYSNLFNQNVTNTISVYAVKTFPNEILYKQESQQMKLLNGEGADNISTAEARDCKLCETNCKSSFVTTTSNTGGDKHNYDDHNRQIHHHINNTAVVTSLKHRPIQENVIDSTEIGELVIAKSVSSSKISNSNELPQLEIKSSSDYVEDPSSDSYNEIKSNESDETTTEDFKQPSMESVSPLLTLSESSCSCLTSQTKVSELSLQVSSAEDMFDETFQETLDLFFIQPKVRQQFPARNRTMSFQKYLKEYDITTHQNQNISDSNFSSYDETTMPSSDLIFRKK